MGQQPTSHSQQLLLPEFPAGDYIETGPSTYQSIYRASQHLKAYSVTFQDQLSFIGFQKTLLLRQQSDFLLKAFFFDLQVTSQICCQKKTGILYLQRDFLRLSEITDVPYPDFLHLYWRCLRGFWQLYEVFGAFGAQEEHVCINGKGEVIVWHHSRVQEGIPQHPMAPTCQTQMLRQVLFILRRNCDETTEFNLTDSNQLKGQPTIPMFQQTLSKTLQRAQTFQEALDLFTVWCSLKLKSGYGTLEIPHKMSCVDKHGLIRQTRIKKDCEELFGQGGRKRGEEVLVKMMVRIKEKKNTSNYQSHQRQAQSLRKSKASQYQSHKKQKKPKSLQSRNQMHNQKNISPLHLPIGTNQKFSHSVFYTLPTTDRYPKNLNGQYPRRVDLTARPQAVKISSQGYPRPALIGLSRGSRGYSPEILGPQNQAREFRSIRFPQNQYMSQAIQEDYGGFFKQRGKQGHSFENYSRGPSAYNLRQRVYSKNSPSNPSIFRPSLLNESINLRLNVYPPELRNLDTLSYKVSQSVKPKSHIVNSKQPYARPLYQYINYPLQSNQRLLRGNGNSNLGQQPLLTFNQQTFQNNSFSRNFQKGFERVQQQDEENFSQMQSQRVYW